MLDRKNIDPKYKWDLTKIYPTEDDFKADYEAAEALVKSFPAHEKTLRCLIDGTDKEFLTARTEGGRLVRFHGAPSLVGTFAEITITGSNTWSLIGEFK